MVENIRIDEAARVATEADIDVVAELVASALDSIAEQRGGNLWTNREARSLPATDSVASAIANPDHQVIVGLLDEQVVGYAMVRLETLADDTVLGVVDDLFVLPEAREVGVGEEVMNQILAWVDEKGCRGIDAAALPGDRQTKNFFESNGLVARAIIVHRDLRD